MAHQDKTPFSIRIVWFMTFLFLALLIYAFTPVTLNMDDIKTSILYLGGPILLVMYLFFAGRGRLRMFPLSPFIPLGVFLLILFLSTLLTGKTYSWIGWQQMGFHISLLGAFFCGFGLTRVKKDIHRILFIWTLLGTGTTLFGLFQYSGGFSLLKRIFITDPNRMITLSNMFNSFITADNEMFSTILQRQFYAAFLVMLLPLAAAYSIVEEESHLRRFVGIASVMLMGVCLYLTHSKTSIGAIVIVAPVFYFLYRRFAADKRFRIPRLGIWLSGLLAIALTLLFFTADVGPAKFKNISRSMESRAIIWKGARDMFLYGPGPDNWYELPEKPPLNLRSLLIGCGPGSFRLIFPRYRNPDYFLHDISHVTLFSHNRFLDLLAETGLVGFLSYMFLLCAFFSRGFRAISKASDRGMRVYSIAFVSSLLGIFLTNFFSPNCRWTVMGSCLWAMWGMGFGTFFVAEEGAHGAESGERKTRIPPSPLVFPASLFLIILLLPVLYVCSQYALNYFTGARYNCTGLFYKQSFADRYEREIQKLRDTARKHPEKAGELNPRIANYQSAQLKYRKLALQAFQQAVFANPAFITTYYKMANTYNEIGDHDSALKTYLEIRKFAPDYSEIHYNLGVVYYTISNQLRQKADNAHDMEEKEKILSRVDEFAALALRELKIAVRMSNSTQIQSNYAKILFQLRKYPEADKVFESLLEREPEETSHLQWLAVSADRQNNPQKALEYYRKMFQIDPLNDAIFNRIEQLYQTLNKPEGFEEFLLEALKTNPLNLKLRIRLLEAYLRKKDMENARRQLTILTRIPDISRMISSDPPKRQEGLFDLARKATKADHREASLFFLQKCCDLDPATSLGKTCRNLLNAIPPQ
ncbi:tetratricopeptide repeat protein [Candidatus Sumerlaeota bacterium]|nr:tetratricopeptide repeat protein [Candidatus Sumerlaeota bacterium]